MIVCKKKFIYCLYSYLNGQIETFLHYTLNVYFWLWLSILSICRLHLWLSVWLFWSIKIISYPIIVSYDNQKLNNQIYFITFCFIWIAQWPWIDKHPSQFLVSCWHKFLLIITRMLNLPFSDIFFTNREIYNMLSLSLNVIECVIVWLSLIFSLFSIKAFCLLKLISFYLLVHLFYLSL